MAEVVAVPTVDEEPVAEAPSAVPASRAASVLDKIRRTANTARENLHLDLALPDTVPGNLGLRLGVPYEAARTVLLVDKPGGGNVDDDLADLSANIQAVVEADGDGWSVVEGLDVITLAAAFAEQLYGAPRPVESETDAVRELFSMGSPPQLNAQAVTTFAAVYRGWSANPTRFSVTPSQGE